MRAPLEFVITGSLGHFLTDEGRYVGTIFLGGHEVYKDRASRPRVKRTRAQSIVGLKSGLLTVVSRSDAPSFNGAYWDCQCACGNMTVARASDLRAGKARSCGCRKGFQRGNKLSPSLRSSM